nr:hypothetical protein CFP56_66652 [Quercus suber]
MQFRENIASEVGVESVFYASQLKIATWKTLSSHLNPYPNRLQTKRRKQPSPQTKAHALTSASSASFTLNLHHRHTDRRSRKSSRHALFFLWGCVILCLPKPQPHHTQELTATELAGAVCGAWKQTGVAVSHDPKEKNLAFTGQKFNLSFEKSF